MWPELILLAYAGLACLARAGHRFRALPAPDDRIVRVGVARIAGWGLLSVALLLACERWGVRQGLVALLGVVTLAGIALVLLLSVRPRAALLPTRLLPARRRVHPINTKGI